MSTVLQTLEQVLGSAKRLSNLDINLPDNISRLVEDLLQKRPPLENRILISSHKSAIVKLDTSHIHHEVEKFRTLSLEVIDAYEQYLTSRDERDTARRRNEYQS